LPEEFLSRTYEELFKEFDLKIKFLPGMPYKFLIKETCEKIGITPANLNHYLKKKKQPSRDKLEDMLDKLNKFYSAVWKRVEFIPDYLKPYVNDALTLEVAEPAGLDSITLEVKALKEMFFEFLHRSDGQTIEQLQEQFLRKKQEAGVWPDV
jgi:transcriptional regulator with XRE-family HTH domain